MKKNKKLSQVQFTPSILGQRKAWLRIVESFTTILLISLVLLIILNRSNFYEGEKVELISDKEYAILREIQLNSSLRNAILGAEFENEVKWDDFQEKGLAEVRGKIVQRTPGQLDCSAKLCEINFECFSDEDPDKSIYVRSSLISANLTKYSPRELKIFCWEK